jgi:hypothetical protein
MAIPAMVRLILVLSTNGQLRPLRISLPRIDALLDGVRYQLEESMAPRSGQELRAHRAPRLRTLVRWALEADNAEQLGERIRRRFEKQADRRRNEIEGEAELDRLLGNGKP